MSKAITERRTKRPRKSYRIPPGPAFTPYTRELGQRVCEHVANGLWLREIAKKPGMPSEVELLQWFRDEGDFQQQFVRAREVSAYSLESEAIELLRKIAKDPKADSLTLKKAEALAVQFRWSAERRNPADFGYRPGAVAAVQIAITTNLDIGQPDYQRAPIDVTPRGRIDAALPKDRERLLFLYRMPADLRTDDEKRELEAAGIDPETQPEARSDDPWAHRGETLDGFERREASERATLDRARERWEHLRGLPPNVRTPEETRELEALEAEAAREFAEVDAKAATLELTALVPKDPPPDGKARRKARKSDPTWPQKLLPPLPGK